MKLLKKVVKRVFEIRLPRIMIVHVNKYGFMSGKVSIDAVLILKRLQEEYHAK